MAGAASTVAIREITARHRAAINPPIMYIPIVASSEGGGTDDDDGSDAELGTPLILFVVADDENPRIDDDRPVIDDAKSLLLMLLVDDDNKLLFIDDVIEFSKSAAGLVADDVGMLLLFLLLGAGMVKVQFEGKAKRAGERAGAGNSARMGYDRPWKRRRTRWCQAPIIQSSRMLLMLLLMLFAFIEAFAPPHHHSTQCRRQPFAATPKNGGTIMGPPIDTKPDYSSINGPMGPLVDSFLMSLFRRKLAEELSRPGNSIQIQDSNCTYDDFNGIIELTTKMNSRFNNKTQIQEIARRVLVSLFPPFILDRYPTWFARPFPIFSARMCAWATVVGGTWLMGECTVNDIPITIDNDGGTWQGVLVQRCKFLEESQCASICVNSCKIPTQNFFRDNMGLALTMTPDYTTGECQFAFGKLPTEEDEREAREIPCLMRCPSGGSLRRWHNGVGDNEAEQWMVDLASLSTEIDDSLSSGGSNCAFMED